MVDKVQVHIPEILSPAVYWETWIIVDHIIPADIPDGTVDLDIPDGTITVEAIQ